MNFKQMSKMENLSYEILNTHKDDLDWIIITRNQIKNNTLTIELIREFKDYVYWTLILKNYQNITIEFIKEFNEYINWSDLSKNLFLTLEVFTEFKNKMYLALIDKTVYKNIISKYVKLHPDFIESNLDNLDFNKIININDSTKIIDINEFIIINDVIDINDVDVLRKFKNELNWNDISNNNHLSIDMIREFKDYINWSIVLLNLQLSSDIITEFKDSFKEIDWASIVYNISLTIEIITEFKNYFCNYDWILLSYNKLITIDLIREFKHCLDWYVITENKLQHIKNNNPSYISDSIEFIREFKDYITWNNTNIEMLFSIEFINEFKTYINWYDIKTKQGLNIMFKYMDLNPKFIEDYKNMLPWNVISYKYKNITDTFIEQYKDEIMFICLYRNPFISNFSIIKYLEELELSFNIYNNYDNYYNDYELDMFDDLILETYNKIANYKSSEIHNIYELISDNKTFIKIENHKDIMHHFYNILKNEKIQLHKDLIEELWKPSRINTYIQQNGDIDGYLD